MVKASRDAFSATGFMSTRTRPCVGLTDKPCSAFVKDERLAVVIWFQQACHIILNPCGTCTLKKKKKFHSLGINTADLRKLNAKNLGNCGFWQFYSVPRCKRICGCGPFLASDVALLDCVVMLMNECGFSFQGIQLTLHIQWKHLNFQNLKWWRKR